MDCTYFLFLKHKTYFGTSITESSGFKYLGFFKRNNFRVFVQLLCLFLLLPLFRSSFSTFSNMTIYKFKLNKEKKTRK